MKAQPVSQAASVYREAKVVPQPGFPLQQRRWRGKTLPNGGGFMHNRAKILRMTFSDGQASRVILSNYRPKDRALDLPL